MNNYIVHVIIFSVVSALLYATGAQADTEFITNTKIEKVLVVGDGSRFGGCMALLDKNPASILPNCGNSWVSFSCTGTYASKDLANRMLDQAQLALALDKFVQIQIDDSKKHNGYCYASRIDIIK